MEKVMSALLNKDINELDKYKLSFGQAAYYVTLDFSSFSGKKTAKDSQVLSLNGRDVSGVTEKPRKRLVDSKAVSFVQKHYMRAKRVFDDIGVPIWGGWLVPKFHIDELKFEFAKIQKSYDQEAHSFVSSYSTLIEMQCAEHPEIADFIRNDAPDAGTVRSKFFMKLSPLLAISLRDENEIEEISNAVSGGLFTQFKKLAESTLDDLTTRETVRPSTIIKKLEQIRAKANTFAFTDPIWDGTVGFVDAIIKRIPSDGKLESQEKALLMLALGMFCDETRLKIAANDINKFDLETILMPKVEHADDDTFISSLMKMREQDDETPLIESNHVDSSNVSELSNQPVVEDLIIAEAPVMSEQDFDLLSAFFS
jgi:hypothetical protein